MEYHHKLEPGLEQNDIEAWDRKQDIAIEIDIDGDHTSGKGHAGDTDRAMTYNGDFDRVETDKAGSQKCYLGLTNEAAQHKGKGKLEIEFRTDIAGNDSRLTSDRLFLTDCGKIQPGTDEPLGHVKMDIDTCTTKHDEPWGHVKMDIDTCTTKHDAGVVGHSHSYRRAKTVDHIRSNNKTENESDGSIGNHYLSTNSIADSHLDLKVKENGLISPQSSDFVVKIEPQSDCEDEYTTAGSANNGINTCLGEKMEIVGKKLSSTGAENAAVHQNIRRSCGKYTISAVKTEPADGNSPSSLPAAERSLSVAVKQESITDTGPYTSKRADSLCDGADTGLYTSNRADSLCDGADTGPVAVPVGLYANESMTRTMTKGVTGQKDLEAGVGLPSSTDGATKMKSRRKSSKTHRNVTQPSKAIIPVQPTSAALNCSADKACRLSETANPQMPPFMFTYTPKKRKKDRLSCPHCDKTFRWQSRLNDHLQSHSGVRPNVCRVCGVAFASPSYLRIHMRRHEGKSAYTCSLCGAEFAIGRDLTLHRKEHADKGDYACEMCGKKCSNANDLSKHRTNDHSNIINKQFPCHLCSQAFKRPCHLDIHLRSHSGYKPFRCTLCDRSYTTQGSLKVHIRSHTGQRPFACTQCDKAFTTSGQLKKHKRTHNRPVITISPDNNTVYVKTLTVTNATASDRDNGADNGKTPQEGKTGQSKRGEIKMEIRALSNARTFHCDVCPAVFIRSCDLASHIRHEHYDGKKENICRECGMTFTRPHTLKKHMRTHMNRKMPSGKRKKKGGARKVTHTADDSGETLTEDSSDKTADVH